MNFKEFFEQRILVEMAIKGDNPRDLIRIDKDDIEFLNQFPVEHWVSAIYQRYHDDLYTALKARQYTRNSQIESIAKELEPLLKNGGWDSFSSNNFTQEDIKKLKVKYGKSWRLEHAGEDFDIAVDNAAKDIAYYATEKTIPDAPEPEERVYNLGTKKDPKRIPAKPFINRLVHKLEKTVGEEHSRGVGLDRDEHPVGMYGFDMANPEKGTGVVPNHTDGMQMVTKTMARTAIKILLQHNYQNYYGELPQTGTLEIPGGTTADITKWKTVRSGKEILKGIVDEKQIKDEVDSVIPSDAKTLIDAEINHTFINGLKLFKKSGYLDLEGKKPHPIKFTSANKTEEEELILRSNNKRTLENDVKKLKQKFINELLAYENKSKNKKNPPTPDHPDGAPDSDIRLPHFKKTININGVDKEIEIPYVLSAKRHRKAVESDPMGIRKGHDKIIVWTGSEDNPHNQGSPGSSGGSGFRTNQNRKEQRPLPFGVDGHKEVANKVFGLDFKKNIYNGINQATQNLSSRNHTEYIVDICRENRSEIYNIIVAFIHTTLNLKKLHTSQGRIDFAKNFTLGIMQQNIHDGGTRRTRDGEQEAPEIPIKTLLTKEQKDFIKKLPNLIHLFDKGRRQFSGIPANSIYSGESIDKIVSSLTKEAEEVDKLDLVKSAKYGRGELLTRDIIEDRITKKNELFKRIREALGIMIAQTYHVYDPRIREQHIENIMSDIAKKSYTMGQIISNLQQLVIVQLSSSNAPKDMSIPIGARQDRSPTGLAINSKGLPLDPYETEDISQKEKRRNKYIYASKYSLGTDIVKLAFNMEYMGRMKYADIGHLEKDIEELNAMKATERNKAKISDIEYAISATERKVASLKKQKL